MNWKKNLDLQKLKSWNRPAIFSMVLLLSMPLLDEITSKLYALLLPLMRDDLKFGALEMGLLFTVGEVISMVLEPFIKLTSDHYSKRWPILGGLLSMGLGFLVASSTPSYLGVLIAFALIIPGGGIAINLSQAALIDQRPGEATQIMARWTILGATGVLISSPLLAAALALGLRWRTLFWIAALIWLGVAALILCKRHLPQFAPNTVHESHIGFRSIWMNLLEALRHPHLLRWVSIVFIAGMLDEVFVSFTALYLKEGVHANPVEISLVFGGQTVGGMLGLALLNHILKSIPMKYLLSLGACLAFIGFVGLLSTPFLWLASIALFVLGLGGSTWYPLAKASAYESLPGRSGTIGAVIDLMAPLQAVTPLAVGFVSQQFGITAGIGLLGLAPIAVLFLIPYSQTSHRQSSEAKNENNR